MGDRERRLGSEGCEAQQCSRPEVPAPHCALEIPSFLPTSQRSTTDGAVEGLPASPSATALRCAREWRTGFGRTVGRTAPFVPVPLDDSLKIDEKETPRRSVFRLSIRRTSCPC
jgi:hypothetical protein